MHNVYKTKITKGKKPTRFDRDYEIFINKPVRVHFEGVLDIPKSAHVSHPMNGNERRFTRLIGKLIGESKRMIFLEEITSEGHFYDVHYNGYGGCNDYNIAMDGTTVPLSQEEGEETYKARIISLNKNKVSSVEELLLRKNK